MRLSKTLMIAGLCAALSGCTKTPDLAGWAVNSAELATAVNVENKKVLDEIDTQITLTELEKAMKSLSGEKADQSLARWRSWRDGYVVYYNEASAALTGMTLYAEAIANLAASGETGRDAVTKGHAALSGIAEQVGRSFPAASGVIAVLSEIADLWTRAEAQEGLAVAMRATQPAIDKLAAVIDEATRTHQNLYLQLHSERISHFSRLAGRNRMAWLKRNNRYSEIEGYFAEAEDDPQTAAAVIYLIEVLMPRFEERERSKAQYNQWVKERRDALEQIRAAVPEWKASHANALAVLEACGGVRSLRVSCGTYSAANLKLAADRIKNVIASTVPQTEPATE